MQDENVDENDQNDQLADLAENRSLETLGIGLNSPQRSRLVIISSNLHLENQSTVEPLVHSVDRTPRSAAPYQLNAPMVQSGNIGRLPLSGLCNNAIPSPLAIIDQIELLELIDRQTWSYRALDYSNGRANPQPIIARRFDAQGRDHHLNLAARLAQQSGDWQEDERLYNTFYSFKPPRFINRMENGVEYYLVNNAVKRYGTLKDILTSSIQVPLSKSKDIFRQLCQIVKFCHSRGVVIKDLKMEKFHFIDPERQTVALESLDQLIICLEDPNSIEQYDDRFHCDQGWLGNLPFATPEMLSNHQNAWYLGRKQNIWCLGIILHALLLNRLPFMDVQQHQIISKILNVQLNLPSEMENMDLYNGLLLIRLILKKDPKDRPSLEEILNSPWLKSRDYKQSFEKPMSFWKDGWVFWRRGGGNGNGDGSSQL